MNRVPVHLPPPAPIVEALMHAGLTRSTAMAMESWKAREVLELLRGSGRGEPHLRPIIRARGSI